MTDHDAGYLQALQDVQEAVRQMVNDLGSSPEGKAELGHVMWFLDDLIRAMNKRHGDHNDQDAPDPLSGGF